MKKFRKNKTDQIQAMKKQLLMNYLNMKFVIGKILCIKIKKLSIKLVLKMKLKMNKFSK